jgi:hypothetical protein
MKREELVEMFKRLFRECDKCVEDPDCGYILWFGDECIALSPLMDSELEQIIKNKCEPMLYRIHKMRETPEDLYRADENTL